MTLQSDCANLPVEFETTARFRAICEKFGYSRNGGNSLKSTIYLMALLACTINIIMGLINNWMDLESRILRLRDLQGFLLLLFFHLISWTIEEFCDNMDDYYSRKQEIKELADVNRRFRAENNMDLKKHCRYTLIILLVRNSATSYLPMGYSVFLVAWAIISGHYDSLENLPVITYFHYPEGYSTWQVRFALNLFATYFYAFNTVIGVVIIMSNYFLGNVCSYQFRLFTCYVKEMDKLESWEESRLKKLMNNIIKYHQTILESHSRCRKVFRWSLVTFNFTCTFQLCTFIYSVVEMRKFRFLIHMFFALLVLYLFSSCGQNLVDEGTTSSETLYECEWSGRPLWFQKNLLLMMTRALSSTEINLYGLLSLNRTSFSKILQAAYTYINFLKGTDK